jgi:hypothetical protein
MYTKKEEENMESKDEHVKSVNFYFPVASYGGGMATHIRLIVTAGLDHKYQVSTDGFLAAINDCNIRSSKAVVDFNEELMRYIRADEFALFLAGDAVALANLQVASEEISKKFEGKTDEQISDLIKDEVGKKISEKEELKNIELGFKSGGCDWASTKIDELYKLKEGERNRENSTKRVVEFLKKSWSLIKEYKDDDFYETIVCHWGRYIDWDPEVKKTED